MMQVVACKKCGKNVDVCSRFCERCGTPIHVILESSTIQNEEFTEIFNSLFYLLADKANPDRIKYFPKPSEDLLFAKVRREYEKAQRNVSIQRSALGLDPFNFDLGTLYMVYNTTILAGYSARVAEELKTGKRSLRLPTEEIDSILVNFIKEGKAELQAQFGYSERDIATPSSKWETFCVALRWKNKYLHFALMDKDELMGFMLWVIEQGAAQTLEAMREAYIQIYGSNKVEKLATKERAEMKATAEMEATNDFLFGYCLKLSESIFSQSS